MHTYMLMDITSEVFGYKIASRVLLYGFLCDVVFSLVTFLIIKIPSATPSDTAAYTLIFYPLLRAVIAQAFGVLTGAYLNIYLITKWKLLLNGKYFWLRSIGSSIAGEGIMLVISVLIALSGVLDPYSLFTLILVTFAYKIAFASIISPFAALVVALLKNKVGENEGYSVGVTLLQPT